MIQKVTVTANTSVALKTPVESALRSESRMLELGLERTRQHLRAFEVQHGMTSEEFERRFEHGEMEERPGLNRVGR